MLRRAPRRRDAAPLLRRALDDRGGLAALEFALIAPLMVMLYFGLAELSSAIIASRHTNHATSAMGDLVSQCANVSDSDLTNMFNASADIMAPLPLATMTQTVTSVTNNNGAYQVQWSRRYTGSTAAVGAGLTPNAAFPFANGASNTVSSNGDTVIVTETAYTFKFPFSPKSNSVAMGGQSLAINFYNGLSFDMLSYFKPRKSSQTTYTGVTASGGTNSQTSCYAS